MYLSIKHDNFYGMKVYGAIIVFGYCAIVYIHGFIPTTIVVALCIILVSFLLPFSYFVHTYYKVNKGFEFEIKSNSITVYRSGKSHVIPSSEIERIIMFKTGSNPRTSFALGGHDFFHFAQIILKSKKEVLITSLLAEHVDEALEILDNVDIEYVWGLAYLSRRTVYDSFLPCESDSILE